MARLKNFYATSNTSEGFYSLFPGVIADLDRIYILKGSPGTGKSTFMRKIGIVLMEKDLDLEYYHCAADNQSLDGVIIPELKIGIIDGTAPHLIEKRNLGRNEKEINFNEYLDEKQLNMYQNDIIKLTNHTSKYFNLAHNKFAEAKDLFKQQENIFSNEINAGKINELTAEIIEIVFKRVPCQENTPTIKKLFFGATTPKGSINFIDNITEELGRRLILKGYLDTEKSELMSKIGKIAENHNLSVEYYYCPFNPKNLDMIIIPSLSICLVDGSSPHSVNPFRIGDEVINLDELIINNELSSKTKERLYELGITYQSLITKGMNYLSEAKRLQDKLEGYYSQAMNFKYVDMKREEIKLDILRIQEKLNYSR